MYIYIYIKNNKSSFKNKIKNNRTLDSATKATNFEHN